ncbi:hypothetical protein KQI42_12245 [Tissierella sp. MSJ-40]|uniref:Uncharacterized protein n=1 Tax=Tissierella simiarum TaxID=2841534 RepID=A0ABS6E998_9FIRM|nr:hypothetical protein [Tissierella simiarum]MBU5438789.1 hypothetical protein [Tissierella simiarum]
MDRWYLDNKQWIRILYPIVLVVSVSVVIITDVLLLKLIPFVLAHFQVIFLYSIEEPKKNKMDWIGLLLFLILVNIVCYFIFYRLL